MRGKGRKIGQASPTAEKQLKPFSIHGRAGDFRRVWKLWIRGIYHQLNSGGVDGLPAPNTNSSPAVVTQGGVPDSHSCVQICGQRTR